MIEVQENCDSLHVAGKYVYFSLSRVCMNVYRVEYRRCVYWFVLVKDDGCPRINPREAAHLLFRSDSECDIPLSIRIIVWREETNTWVNWRFTWTE